jgi:hypothetical protein
MHFNNATIILLIIALSCLSSVEAGGFFKNLFKGKSSSKSDESNDEQAVTINKPARPVCSFDIRLTLSQAENKPKANKAVENKRPAIPIKINDSFMNTKNKKHTLDLLDVLKGEKSVIDSSKLNGKQLKNIKFDGKKTVSLGKVGKKGEHVVVDMSGLTSAKSTQILKKLASKDKSDNGSSDEEKFAGKFKDYVNELVENKKIKPTGKAPAKVVAPTKNEKYQKAVIPITIVSSFAKTYAKNHTVSLLNLLKGEKTDIECSKLNVKQLENIKFDGFETVSLGMVGKKGEHVMVCLSGLTSSKVKSTQLLKKLASKDKSGGSPDMQKFVGKFKDYVNRLVKTDKIKPTGKAPAAVAKKDQQTFKLEKILRGKQTVNVTASVLKSGFKYDGNNTVSIGNVQIDVCNVNTPATKKMILACASNTAFLRKLKVFLNKMLKTNKFKNAGKDAKPSTDKKPANATEPLPLSTIFENIGKPVNNNTKIFTTPAILHGKFKFDGKSTVRIGKVSIDVSCIIDKAIREEIDIKSLGSKGITPFVNKLKPFLYRLIKKGKLTIPTKTSGGYHGDKHSGTRTDSAHKARPGNGNRKHPRREHGSSDRYDRHI